MNIVHAIQKREQGLGNEIKIRSLQKIQVNACFLKANNLIRNSRLN